MGASSLLLFKSSNPPVPGNQTSNFKTHWLIAEESILGEEGPFVLREFKTTVRIDHSDKGGCEPKSETAYEILGL